MKLLFWLSLIGTLYTYLGYPLAIYILARLRPRPWKVAPIAPSVSVVLAVHNEGPPIPPDAMGRIFEPLTHGQDHAKASTSLGLGLYIVRQIVTAHGGTITVASSTGEGTTFTVRLPRRPLSNVAQVPS